MSTTQRIRGLDCVAYGVATGIQCLVIGSVYSALLFPAPTGQGAIILLLCSIIIDLFLDRQTFYKLRLFVLSN